MASNGLAHRLYVGDISYDFIGHRKTWYTVSAVALLIAVLALVFRPLNLGIEFRGGASFLAPLSVTSTTVDDAKAAIRTLNLPHMDDVVVTTIGSAQVNVETRTLSVDEVSLVKGAIATVAKTQPDNVAYNLIGASWGEQITSKALLGLAVFVVLVMILMWAYFREFKMGVAGIAALAHDLLITVGFYALVGFSVTPATLIGVLTILGYSLYDTVVVFDKVRENTKDLMRSKFTYSEAANRATNQVLVRSLNTTVIGVLPVAAILFAGAFILGEGPLKDLGLALFVGMIVGAYSSIFIATPLLTQMKELEPANIEHRQRLARRAERQVTAPAATSKVSVAVAGGKVVATPASTATTSEAAAARVQPQRPPRSKRKK